MKKSIAFLLLLLFAANALVQESVFFKGTLEQAKEKAEAENKLILLDISSDG